MGMHFGGEDDDFNRALRGYTGIDATIARLQDIKVAIVQACNRIENASSDLYGQQFKTINAAIDEIRREAGKI